MQPQVQHILEKLKRLSPERLTEVDDFVDFLNQRDQDKRLRKDYTPASEHSFKEVWDNDDHTAYDKEATNCPTRFSANERIVQARALRAMLEPQSFAAHEIDFLKRDR